MTARFYADLDLQPGSTVVLPDHAARHIQVLRLQPGGLIALFNSKTVVEGEFEATVIRMGRSDVEVTIGSFIATQREARRAVHLVMGIPANERMDWLIEKATELGVTSIQPLMTERSVLRVKGDRADKKLGHWRGVAIAACEQSGRNRVPLVHEIVTLSEWLKNLVKQTPTDITEKLLLSLQAGSRPLAEAANSSAGALTFLSGPEGGLSAAEEAAAMAAGFAPITLGPRVLRAETAPLACLSLISLMSPS